VTDVSTTLVRPRFGRIKDATKYCALSRNTLYGLASKHEGLFKKRGASTLVDFGVLDQILDALPAAQIAPPKRAAPKAQPQPRRRRKRAA
jgi:hypothetical protein